MKNILLIISLFFCIVASAQYKPTNVRRDPSRPYFPYNVKVGDSLGVIGKSWFYGRNWLLNGFVHQNYDNSFTIGDSIIMHTKVHKGMVERYGVYRAEMTIGTGTSLIQSEDTTTNKYSFMQVSSSSAQSYIKGIANNTTFTIDTAQCILQKNNALDTINFSLGSQNEPWKNYSMRKIGNSGYLNNYDGEINFSVLNATKWRINSNGYLESPLANWIQTQTGGLSIATNGANGNINLLPHNTGNVGINAGIPLHKLTIESANTTGVNMLNIVNSDKNIIRTPLVQAIDTSSFNLYFTPLGKPVFNINTATGATGIGLDSTGLTTLGGGLTFTGAQSIKTTTGNLTLNPTNGNIVTTMTDTTKALFIGGATINKAPLNIKANSLDGCVISITNTNTNDTVKSTFIGQLAGKTSQIPVTIMGCYNTYNVSNASAINSLSIGGGYSKGQAATGIGFYTSGTGANVPSGTLRWSINSAGVLLGGISAGVPHEIRLNGTAYGESGVARNTTANTAGVGYTWYLSGGCTTGSTDKGAGTAAIATGIATGNGGSIMNLQTVTANQGTGTADRAPSTKISILNTGGLIYTPKNTGNIDAGTGLTAAMLSFDIRYNGASAIDISANPQIIAGTDGQVIKIIGTSDANTLTIDDGNGVNCPATRVIGLNDVWEATFANSVWVETNFIDN